MLLLCDPFFMDNLNIVLLIKRQIIVLNVIQLNLNYHANSNFGISLYLQKKHYQFINTPKIIEIYILFFQDYVKTLWTPSESFIIFGMVYLLWVYQLQE